MILTINNFLLSMVILYFTAAIFSLIFKNKQKSSNVIANLINALASVLGIVSSVSLLLWDPSHVLTAFFKTSIPFINFVIRIDSISAFFILALSVLNLCVSIYSIGYNTHYLGKKPIWLLNSLIPIFVLSMILVFAAGDAILFMVAWEVMATVSYFLVMFEHENEETKKAGKIYIIMTHVGTAFLMVAFLTLYINTGSFDFANWSNCGQAIKGILFLLFTIGFGTKAGIVPLHIWLPYAHPAAPGNVSALMSGIMIKTAIYGMVRFVFDIIGVKDTWWGILLIVLGAVSAVIGISYGYVSKNMKRMLAYSSIENIGIIFMGLGVAAVAAAGGNMVLAMFAIIAAMIHTFNHSLFKGLMFLNSASVHFAAHTKDLEKLGGLIKKMPYTGAFTLIGSLALSAIVPLNGFVGEWFTYQSFFMNIKIGEPLINIVSILAVAALAFAGALAAGTFVKLIGIAFLGCPRTQKAEDAKEVPKIMLFSKGIMALMCIIIGIFPLPLIYLAQKAFETIFKVSIISNLNGVSSFLVMPITFKGGSIMPVAAFLGIIVAVILAIALTKIIGGKTKSRIYGTWDCGYKGINKKMQYSARGFSNPMKIIMKVLYKPHTQITADNDESPYNPQAIKYELKTEKIFEKHLYEPLTNIIKKISQTVQLKFHTGSVHMYLIYIFTAVFLLLIYTRLF